MASGYNGARQKKPVDFAENMRTIEETIVHLYNNRQHTGDVYFEIECEDMTKRIIPAHKLILLMRSQVFAKMILHADDQHKYPIKIGGVSVLGFETVLRYIYGIRVDLANRETNVETAIEMFKAADLFRLKNLKEQFLTSIVRVTLTADNVCCMLKFADYLDIPILRDLKSRCFAVIQKKTAEVMQSSDFCNAPLNMMLSVLHIPKLSLKSEYHLLEHVLAWAKANYLTCSSCSSIREAMEPLLPLLNFTILSGEEFSRIASNHRELFEPREGFAIFMNIHDRGSADLPSWHMVASETKRKYTG